MRKVPAEASPTGWRDLMGGSLIAFGVVLFFAGPDPHGDLLTFLFVRLAGPILCALTGALLLANSANGLLRWSARCALVLVLLASLAEKCATGDLPFCRADISLPYLGRISSSPSVPDCGDPARRVRQACTDTASTSGHRPAANPA